MSYHHYRSFNSQMSKIVQTRRWKGEKSREEKEKEKKKMEIRSELHPYTSVAG